MCKLKTASAKHGGNGRYSVQTCAPWSGVRSCGRPCRNQIQSHETAHSLDSVLCGLFFNSRCCLVYNLQLFIISTTCGNKNQFRAAFADRGVSGYVRDQATLAALGGATVKLIRAGVVQAETTTGASGYYALANLIAGTYTLSVNVSGYRNSSHDLAYSDSGVVLDFYLSPIPSGTYQLSGVVYSSRHDRPDRGSEHPCR